MKIRSMTAVLVAAALCLVLAAPVAAADPVRPFGGTAMVSVETEGPPTGCAPDAMGRESFVAQGQLLHLGRSTLEGAHCTHLDMATGAGSLVDGMMTITAANGDTLAVAYHGTFRLYPWPNPEVMLDAAISWTITGGTGRFANATGTGSVGVTETEMMVFEGTIAY
jgi:hypothetical protein